MNMEILKYMIFSYVLTFISFEVSHSNLNYFSNFIFDNHICRYGAM